MMCIAWKKRTSPADSALLQQVMQLNPMSRVNTLQKDFVLALYYSTHGEQAKAKEIWEKLSQNENTIYGKMAYYNNLVQSRPDAADSLQKSNFFNTKLLSNQADELVPENHFNQKAFFDYITYKGVVWYRFSNANTSQFYIRRSSSPEPIPAGCRGVPFAGGNLFIVNTQKLIRTNPRGKVTEVIDFIPSH